MKTVLSFVILVSGIASQLAAGQDVSAQAKSFAALRFVLDVGQVVRVRDETGHSTKGKVVAITETQLVVSHKGLFRSRTERAFTPDIIRRIEIVDSGWNGAVIGGAAALAFVATAVKFGCDDSCDKTGSWVLGVVTFVPIGIGIGGAIDSRINKTIYEGRLHKPRVTVVPWVERDRKGVLARVTF